MSPTVSKFALVLLGLLPVAGVAQTEPAVWRFVPSNAKALISIDWGRLRRSHIGTMLREKWVDGAAVPGSEFLDDAERFVISSPGKNPDQPEAEAPLLIVVSGHFDLPRVRTVLAQHKVRPQKYNSFQVYRPQGKDPKDLAFVLFDGQTVLIGDSRSIFAGLDKAAFPPAEAAPGSLVARAADMDSNYDVWAIVNTPDALGGDRLTALLSGSDGDAVARGFEFGLSLRSGMAADFTLMFGSDSAAKQMVEQLSRMVKMTVKDRLGEPALLDLEKKMKFTAQGSVAKLSVRLTAQELDKNAKLFAASHKPSAPPVAEIRPVVKPTPAAAPGPPPLPEKKVIRIEGLDDGPREIPYHENQ